MTPWERHVLVHLGEQKGARFSDLAGAPGLSRRVLAEVLRDLQHRGLIRAEQYSDRPPRRHYLLTSRGSQARRLALALSHVLAGGSLDVRGFVAPDAAPQLPAHPSDGLLESDPQQAWSIFEATVQPLVRYDEQYSTDLVGTLAAYLECDASVSVAAAQLFTHRHTVRYRLARVNELTGLNVDSLEDRERLTLGLRAMNLFRRLGRQLLP